MNQWTFSGTVEGHGLRNAKSEWPTLWIKIALDPVEILENGTMVKLQKNCCFLNVDIVKNQDQPRGKASTKLLNDLTTQQYPFIFVPEAQVVPITFSKKNANDEWEKYQKTGARASPSQVWLRSHRIEAINAGLVSGRVAKQSGNRILIEDRYRSPKDGWKTREIPMILNQDYSNLTNKEIFCRAALCGLTTDNEDKTYGVSLLTVL